MTLRNRDRDLFFTFTFWSKTDEPTPWTVGGMDDGKLTLLYFLETIRIMSIPYVADEEEWDSLIVREQTSPLLRTWGTFAVSPWQNGLYKPITNHFLHLGWRSTNNYVKEGVNGCTSVVVPMHRAFLVYMASHNFTHACTRPLRVYGSLFLLSRKKRCNSIKFFYLVFSSFFSLAALQSSKPHRVDVHTICKTSSIHPW